MTRVQINDLAETTEVSAAESRGIVGGGNFEKQRVSAAIYMSPSAARISPVAAGVNFRAVGVGRFNPVAHVDCSGCGKGI